MQRLAQIMACGCKEAGFGHVGQLEFVCALLDPPLERRIGSLELRSHVVELLAQDLEFVAGLDGDTLAQITTPNSRCASLERFNRADHPTRKQEASDDGKPKRGKEQCAGTVDRSINRCVGLRDR